MEAIFLVGGKGTRLHPLTLERPKPMLKVAGVPFIAHQIGYAIAHGITRIVVATSYKTEQFLHYLGDGSAFGIEIVHAIEEEPLGTGGAISNASAYLTSGESEPVAILNGDILSAHDIGAQIHVHKERGADVTLHLIEVDDARPYGSVPTDSEGCILEFIEKSDAPPTNFINAGSYIFTRSVIDEIPKGKVVSVERETFPELLSEGRKLWSFKSRDYWIDIGTPKALLKASQDLLYGVFHSPALSPVALAAKKFVDEQADIDPSAQIGIGCAVGACTVGADVIIEASLVGDGVVIGAGANIRASIIGDGATVEAGAVLRESVLGGSGMQIAPQSLE